MGQRSPDRRVPSGLEASRHVTPLKLSTTGHPATHRHRGRERGALVVALLLIFPAIALPHDLWVVPGRFHLAEGELTRIFINNGDAFPESLTLLGQHRVSELVVRGPDGDRSVSEFRVDGTSLTFEFPESPPGIYVIALGTRPRRVRLQAEDFEDYLKEEGLDSMATLREENEEGDGAAVERYTKWAKTVIEVGEPEIADDQPWAVPVGETLEIVPLDPPTRIVPGGRLRLRVLFEGEPLASVRLIGSRAAGPQREISETTDALGEAEVLLPLAGRWNLRALHMIRRDEDPEMRWESFWCTLTVEVAASGKPSSPAGSERRSVASRTNGERSQP